MLSVVYSRRFLCAIVIVIHVVSVQDVDVNLKAAPAAVINHSAAVKKAAVVEVRKAAGVDVIAKAKEANVNMLKNFWN